MTTVTETMADFSQVKKASRDALRLRTEIIDRVLKAVADAAVAHTNEILRENQKDLDRMDPANPKYDRLKLTEERIQTIARDMRNVADLASPLGRTLETAYAT